MPNDLQNQEIEQAQTSAKSEPATDSMVATQAKKAVELAQTALTEVLNAIRQSGAATNPQTIQQALENLTKAEEILDQAETSAIAANLPKQN